MYKLSCLVWSASLYNYSNSYLESLSLLSKFLETNFQLFKFVHFLYKHQSGNRKWYHCWKQIKMTFFFHFEIPIISKIQDLHSNNSKFLYFHQNFLSLYFFDLQNQSFFIDIDWFFFDGFQKLKIHYSNLWLTHKLWLKCQLV